jgi:hypothetical protein
MTRAGTPPATEYGGIGFVTTALAAMAERLPMLFMIVHFEKITTSS